MSKASISDERRSAIAIFLSILVIFTWTTLTQPTPQKVATPVVTEETIPAKTKEVPAVVAPQDPNVAPKLVAADPVRAEFLPPADYLKADTITIESDLYIAKVGLLGGRLLSLELKNYYEEADRKEEVNLVKAEGRFLPLGLTSDSLTDEFSLYAIRGISASGDASQREFRLKKGEKLSFSLVGSLADGNSITKNFSFDADSYLFKVAAELGNGSTDGSLLKLNWNTYLPASFFTDRYNYKTVFHRKDNGAFSQEHLDGSGQTYQSVSNLTGLGDNYFMVSLLSAVGPKSIEQKIEKQIDGGSLISIAMPGEPNKAEIQVYAGPKDPKVLEKVGYDLHKAIDLGWFAFVGQPLLKLIELCYSLLGNYGLAIILVTILIKLLLLPLTKKSFLSMQAMQKVQPQIVALRERIKDPAVVQQEMLKIYQQNGVNPLGGCLPMLLQMPVFLGMYNALQSSIYLRHADFALWINDLSSPEKCLIFGIPVPIMILLMGASMFLQTMTMPTTADANQKKIMYMMPVMFTIMFIIMPFPSGLVLYWLVNNIMSIIQQYALRTERNIQPLPATLVSGVIVFAIGFVVTLF